MLKNLYLIYYDRFKKNNFFCCLSTKKVQVAYMCLILSFEMFLAPNMSVTVSHNDITYSNINMQLSYRGTDSVCCMKGLDSFGMLQ